MKNLVFCIFLLAATAHAGTDAEEILKAARTNPLGRPVVLNAQLRANGTKVPFQIAVRDGKISYLFENPAQEILLGLGDSAGAERQPRRTRGTGALR